MRTPDDPLYNPFNPLTDHEKKRQRTKPSVALLNNIAISIRLIRWHEPYGSCR
jgi:hypothetical protein